MQNGQSLAGPLEVKYPAGRKKLVQHPREPIKEETEEHKNRLI